MNTVFENQRKRLTLWTNYVFWKNVLLLSTYRCKNVEKVDRLFLAALEKNAMRTKKAWNSITVLINATMMIRQLSASFYLLLFFMILSNLVKIAQKYIFGPLVYHNLAFLQNDTVATLLPRSFFGCDFLFDFPPFETINNGFIKDFFEVVLCQSWGLDVRFAI